jgi:hypothetical protein
MVGLAPEPYAYGSLRGLGELIPSTIPLVGLATRPIYFVMASSANISRLPLLGLLVFDQKSMGHASHHHVIFDMGRS